MKVVIVGGVAGGASCAARLRRLDEKAEILMVERGPYVSYANCGLPYHISGVIPKESSLLIANEQFFKGFFNIDVRTGCEAVSIDRKKKTVDLKNVATGEVETESYDKLVLSPGAASIRPPLPGIDLPGIFQVRTVPDARAVKEWIEKGTTFLAGVFNYSGIQFVKPPKRAVVIGGGFIGLETAENLVHAGFEVTLLEMLDQVLAPLDREFATLVEDHLKRHGVRLALGDGVAGFTQLEGGAIEVKTKSGKAYPAEVVILALGVRPDTTLAKAAGLEIGERGGIRVDEQMRTSDPDIFAVGDVVEVKDWVTGQWGLVALAGPANRQGRIAADVIAGRDSRFRGTQGTSIIGLFGAAVAWTGVNEKTLKRNGDTDYEKVYLFPNAHAGYYPGAKMLGLKVLFRKSDGRLLGSPVPRRGRAGGGQADQRPGDGPPDEGDDAGPRGGRALLRAPVRQREGPGQFRRNGRGRRAPRRHAARALGKDGRRVPPRRARAGRARRREPPGRRQHPAPAAPRAPRRAAEGPGDSHRLPLRGARLLRDADPPAERLQGPGPLRRHAVAGDGLGEVRRGE